MDIDFKTVKALSSSSRIEILEKCFKAEETPTTLADKTGKSKSTVSSHLEKLMEADLLEKEEVEGRKRVVYKPSSKAEAIAKGRKIKMSLSLTATLVGFVLGFGSVMNLIKNLGGEKDGLAAAEAETGVEAAISSGEPSTGVAIYILIIVLSLGISGLTLVLTWFYFRTIEWCSEKPER